MNGVGLAQGIAAPQTFEEVSEESVFVGDLGECIRTFRRANRISATLLADRLEISRPTLWSWETGRSLPRSRNLERLQQVLGITLAPPEPLTEVSLGAGLDRTIQAHKAALAKAIGLDVENIRIEISV